MKAAPSRGAIRKKTLGDGGLNLFLNLKCTGISNLEILNTPLKILKLGGCRSKVRG